MNGKWPLLFSGHNMFIINGILMVVIFVIIYFGIYDVITRKDDSAIEKAQNGDKELDVPKNKFRFIVKQACNLVRTEPYVIFGILGSGI